MVSREGHMPVSEHFIAEVLHSIYHDCIMICVKKTEYKNNSF